MNSRAAHPAIRPNSMRVLSNVVTLDLIMKLKSPKFAQWQIDEMYI